VKHTQLLYWRCQTFCQ